MIFFVGAYIFVFNLIFIKSETYSSVLVNGIKNYFHDIKPRDINIYHYNSSSLQVDFFLEKIKGSPLMYSYLSNDANHYLPTEDELRAEIENQKTIFELQQQSKQELDNN